MKNFKDDLRMAGTCLPKRKNPSSTLADAKIRNPHFRRLNLSKKCRFRKLPSTCQEMSNPLEKLKNSILK
uniref:Uncharacterized protein n=1 Tax=Romanomermis culicivorax TaxID=13658 RepID=A0A915HUY2_ROMCU